MVCSSTSFSYCRLYSSFWEIPHKSPPMDFLPLLFYNSALIIWAIFSTCFSEMRIPSWSMPALIKSLLSKINKPNCQLYFRTSGISYSNTIFWRLFFDIQIYNPNCRTFFFFITWVVLILPLMISSHSNPWTGIRIMDVGNNSKVQRF